MKIIAIIVTYNGAHWIQKCIGSLVNSDTPVDIIIIDNGSTDDTIKIIENDYRHVQLVKTEKNLGFGKANNIGLQMALRQSADYVLLLNQDAWVASNTISQLVLKQTKYPEYGILSPVHLTGNGNALDEGFKNYLCSNNRSDLISAIYLNSFNDEPYAMGFVNAACWLLNRHCIETIGGFSPSFYHYGEDDNYIQRLFYHNLKIGVVPQVVAFHDRAFRPQQPCFDEAYQVQKNWMIRFNNPLANISVKDEKMILIKNIAKALVMFDGKKIKTQVSILRFINKIAKASLQNREQSKIPGKSFL